MPEHFPSELVERLPEYLAAQRWYAGSEPPPAAEVEVTAQRLLWSAGADHQMWQLILDVAGETYQVVLGVRPDGEPADFLNGHDSSVVGSAEGVFAYDATWDSELARKLLEAASGGRESASRSRPMAAEQSNTSIVYDDRLILKLFRHLRPGPNPDVEVTSALADVGFANVAAPLVRWRDGTYDLAFGQEFLSGGSEGWALALTSLRDFYNSPEVATPAEAGGDFGGEAGRLGKVTADMHLGLQKAFGTATPDAMAGSWAALVASLAGRLEAAGRHLGRDLLGAARTLLVRLEEVSDPGPGIRVHGDYHLGQVMRTDMGWYVLDFEGEPGRPVEERTRPASVFKDVTGMLRSLHYASRHALVERAVADWAEMVPAARMWESHNRQAFLEGYRRHPEVSQLLPDAEVAAAVMTAYELDKCLYELDYELLHRPEWVAIPLDALERLVEGGGDG